MTLLEAMKILAINHPTRIATGYWLVNGDYIFNTKTVKFRKGMDEPGQYVVTKDGKTYATNPMRTKLDMTKMKKI